MTMHAYIINLQTKPEKYEKVSNQLNKYKIPHERFIAYTTPSTLFSQKSKSNMFTKGMIGCASSHMAVWEKIAGDKNQKYRIILEDDAVLCSMFKTKFHFYNSYIPLNWDMVMLGTIMKEGDSNAMKTIHGVFYDYGKNYKINKYVYRLKNFIGCHGYMLSKKGAEKLIKGIEISSGHIDLDISKYLYSHWGSFQAYCFNEDLVSQSNVLFESSININRQPFFINSILDTHFVIKNKNKKMSIAYVLNEPIGQIGNQEFNVQLNIMNVLVLLIGIIFGLSRRNLIYSVGIFGMIEYIFLKFENVQTSVFHYKSIFAVFITGYVLGMLVTIF